jgi:hypothetical protein
MRRFALLAGVACAAVLVNSAGAQFNSPTVGGSAMPGQVVGSYSGQVNPVGQRAPAAAPQAGQSITANAMQRPYDPNRPYDAFKGTNIDPKNVIAPLVGPDGKQMQQPDALDKLSEKIRAFFVRNPPPPRPTYAPGVTRRSHERHDQMWRRD